MSAATPKLLELKDFCRLSQLKCSGNKAELIDRINKHLSQYKFAPRYLRGLSTSDKFNKKFEIKYSQLYERFKGQKKYSPTPTDVLYKSKNIQKISKYTQEWNNRYPSRSLPEKSKTSGVPLDILKKVYNKGLGAWRGGSHRPGASQQSWGVARVNSFLLCGKTWQFPDHLLVKDAMSRSPRAKRFWKSCNKKLLGVKTRSR
jgi:hypothetical protein